MYADYCLWWAQSQAKDVQHSWGSLRKKLPTARPVPGCCVDRQSHAERGQQQPSKQLKLGVDPKKCRQMFRSDQHDFTATLYTAAGKTHKKEAQNGQQSCYTGQATDTNPPNTTTSPPIRREQQQMAHHRVRHPNKTPDV